MQRFFHLGRTFFRTTLPSILVRQTHYITFHRAFALVAITCKSTLQNTHTHGGWKKHCFKCFISIYFQKIYLQRLSKNTENCDAISLILFHILFVTILFQVGEHKVFIVDYYSSLPCDIHIRSRASNGLHGKLTIPLALYSLDFDRA